MKTLPDAWNCDDLLIRKATPTDTDALTALCNSWDNKQTLEGEPFPSDYIRNCLQHGDLPPLEDACIDNYSLMAVQDARGEIIGFFDTYHGYPQKDCIWISIFLIDKQHQRHYYGQKVITSLINHCRENNWKHCGVGVYLKNWPALRFWSRNGFSRIGRIYGDKEYSENTFSVVSLFNDL